MEKNLQVPKAVKRRHGPKKLFLSRLSTDSDSGTQGRLRSSSSESDFKYSDNGHSSWNTKNSDKSTAATCKQSGLPETAVNQSGGENNQSSTSHIEENQSSLDLLASFASPKHNRVESLSAMSLPDDLRLSFSEIEESSLHLDDLDLTCSPKVDRSNLDQNDSDLQRMISSSSDKGGKNEQSVKLTDISHLSSEFKKERDDNEGNESAKGDGQVDDGITWDDLVTWGVDAQQVSTVGSTGEVQPRKKSISRQRANKNKHMENVSCQVCGDLAAGFYCGAFICEACKKFYMRAYKQDKLKYVCLRDKKCVITKESRVQCQYCRYQKCVALNMYIPKQGENEMSKDMQMSDIPCRVCSAPSSGFHFGAITCEGCKGFFRRMAKEREPERYQCNKKGDCEINMVTRNLCKACRYRACLRAGMSVEGSRIGRQPNSVKHAISMELKQGKPENPNFYLVSVKEEPSENSVDFLNDGEKNDIFSFWNSNSNGPDSQHQNYNDQSPSYNNMFNVSSACTTQQVTNNISMKQQEASYSQSQIMSATSPTSVMSLSPSPVVSPHSTVPGNPHERYSSSSQSPVGVDNYSRKRSMTDNGVPVSRQQCTPPPGNTNQGFQVPAKAPPPHLNSSGKNSSQALVFTPSPVSQFFTVSSSPSVNSQSPTLPPKQSTNPNMRLPGYSSGQLMSHSPVDSHRSPTAMSSPSHVSSFSPTIDKRPRLSDSNIPQGKDMDNFISRIVEAGKCLQLLNYRVFDTDVNPTTSMNVDEIKALFKSQYMDPRAGNTITSKVDISIFSTRESTWNYMMTNFHHNTYITIRFAKLVPGFKSLSLNDQVKLIQSSIYPIELLNMSKVFDPATRKYNYFTYTKEEEDIMMEQFPMLRVFQEHFLHVGEMVTSFHFTDEEFAILSALLLFPAEINGLENPKAVEDLQSQMSAALQYYEEKTFPDGLTRYGILLVRVAELVQCLLQHNLAIGLLLTHNPTIKVPQLFHELIIESIKEGQKTC